MENKRVRISDIAEELGLSTATVSNLEGAIRPGFEEIAPVNRKFT